MESLGWRIAVGAPIGPEDVELMGLLPARKCDPVMLRFLLKSARADLTSSRAAIMAQEVSIATDRDPPRLDRGVSE